MSLIEDISPSEGLSSSYERDVLIFYGSLDSSGGPARPVDANAQIEVGMGISSAGDQNNDGYEDILLGGCTGYCNDNNIYLFYGAPN